MRLEVWVRRTYSSDQVKGGKHDRQGGTQLVGNVDQKVALEIVDLLPLLVSALQGLEHAVDRVCQAVDFVWWSLWRETAGMILSGGDASGSRRQPLQGTHRLAYQQPDRQPCQYQGDNHPGNEDVQQAPKGKIDGLGRAGDEHIAEQLVVGDHGLTVHEEECETHTRFSHLVSRDRIAHQGQGSVPQIA